MNRSAPAASFFGLAVLRAAFGFLVLERVERGGQQPVRTGLADDLQGGDRFQVAHRALTGVVAGQAIAAEQQELVEAGAVHALQLRQQVAAFAVLAREVQQGGDGVREAGEGLQWRHVQGAADAVADGHGQWPAAQLGAGHEGFEAGETLGAGLGDEFQDAGEGVGVQGRFQQAHGVRATGLGQGGSVRQIGGWGMSDCAGDCAG